MSRAGLRRAALPGIAIACLAWTSCDEDPVPPVDLEVRVFNESFNPRQETIPAGGTVRWVNYLRGAPENRRTVTSGSPGDEDAGERFDISLEGFGNGEPYGDVFTLTFAQPETVRYFSRLPQGREFTGMIIVQ